jgi:hypothetical protein
MSQRRMVHTKLWSSERVGQLCHSARLLFIGCITLADDEGKLKAHPAYLKGQIFPYDEDVGAAEITKWRAKLHDAGLINLYTVDEKEYMQHPNWAKYQTLRKDRTKKGILPDFPVKSV